MSTLENYTDLLESVVRPLLTEPEAFEIVSATREKIAVSIEFKVSEADTGRVIGSKGATIRAIRSTLEFAGANANERVAVELKDA